MGVSGGDCQDLVGFPKSFVIAKQRRNSLWTYRRQKCGARSGKARENAPPVADAQADSARRSCFGRRLSGPDGETWCVVRRPTTGDVSLRVPRKKVTAFCRRKGYGVLAEQNGRHRPRFLDSSDVEILPPTIRSSGGLPTTTWLPTTPSARSGFWNSSSSAA